MNCQQANTSVQLTDLMTRLGFDVKKKERGGREWRYLSPFRSEAEPSFYIETGKNCWFDHGEGEGGTVVDFMVHYLKSNGRSSSVSDALTYLEDLGFGAIGKTKRIFSSESKPVNDTKPLKEIPRDLEFIRAGEVQHPAIFQYLESRYIPRALVKKYLKEIQYRNIKKNKVYFGFGLSNRAGGWEIRSASDKPAFKSALIKRDISIILGSASDGQEVNVFEGTIDYLSLLVFLGVDQMSNDSVIMHSLSSYEDTAAYIAAQDYQNINLFLDNDTSGKKMVQKFASEPSGTILDYSGSYQGLKDLNAALVANMGQKTGFLFTATIPIPPEPNDLG